MERVDGIEPTSSAWKAAALPLCYTRAINMSAFVKTMARHFCPIGKNGGEGWIRTSVRSRGQIYSLLPLTTRPPVHTSLPATGCPALFGSRRGSLRPRKRAVGEAAPRCQCRSGCRARIARLGPAA